MRGGDCHDESRFDCYGPPSFWKGALMMSDLDPFAGLAKVLSALPGLSETVQLAALGTVCFLALVIAVVFLWPKKPRE